MISTMRRQGEETEVFVKDRRGVKEKNKVHYEWAGYSSSRSTR